AWRRSLLSGLFQGGHDRVGDDFRTERPGEAVGNPAIAVDHKGFRDTINAEVDSGKTVLVRSDGTERITVVRKESARSFGFVFIVDTVDGNACLAQLDQLRMLGNARGAPGSPDIQNGGLTGLERRRRQAGNGTVIAQKVGNAWKCELRNRL